VKTTPALKKIELIDNLTVTLESMYGAGLNITNTTDATHLERFKVVGTNSTLFTILDTNACSFGINDFSSNPIFRINDGHSIKIYSSDSGLSSIGSPTFNSGLGGSGWKIRLESDKSTTEFNDLVIRGTMRVYELLIN
jgi:hypothetical protein